ARASAGSARGGWTPAVRGGGGGGAPPPRLGPAARSIALSRIHAVERVPALAYHRRWRRYAAVRAFVNRIPPEVLLLRTAGGPVVLGLPEPELDRLEAFLRARLDRAEAEAALAGLIRAA
ncbi:MAG: hypothetical protein R3362_13635, partial [Rhodothermales bacterium]|nr:hypothetical protein [Rhodothermales bacterium]